MYQSPLSENARQRLGILRDSNDGFLIAEKDLQLRGPGEVMGIRQTGQVTFKIADLVRDADLLDNIPTIADSLFAETPESIAPLIKRWLGHRPDYSEV
jgi:ATP-dependent DNA helicase RecG